MVTVLAGACAASTPSPSATPAATSGGSTAPASSVPASTAPTPSAAAVPIEIRIWSPHGPNFDNVAKTAITDYQTAHPNVTIKIEPVDNPVYLQRILTAAAAGTLPDIIYANPGTVASMIESGTVFGPMPVDQFKDELTNTVPAFAKLMQDKSGTQFLLPIFGGYHGWDYLVQDLAAAGFPEFPKTWSQLIDACQKLVTTDAKGDIKREGLSWRFRTYGPRIQFQGLLGTQGISMIDADGKVHIDTPEGLNVLTLMHDTVYKQKCSLPVSKKGVPQPGVLGLTTGAAAIEWQFPGSGNSAILYAKDHPEFADKWNKTALWPKPDSGGTDYVLISGDGFGVSKASPNAATAWDFLKFLSQNKYFDQIATFATVARSDVMKDPSVTAYYTKLPNAKNMLDLFTNPAVAAAAVPDITGVATPKIEQVMADAITKMFEDPKANLPAVLKDMQSQVEAALKP
jgi:multiple sugar transport system substrate-binding protein/arabinogalactan oligomer/maltooligosaccharide transport system substrate-binding protein